MTSHVTLTKFSPTRKQLHDCIEAFQHAKNSMAQELRDKLAKRKQYVLCTQKIHVASFPVSTPRFFFCCEKKLGVETGNEAINYAPSIYLYTMCHTQVELLIVVTKVLFWPTLQLHQKAVE